MSKIKKVMSVFLGFLAMGIFSTGVVLAQDAVKPMPPKAPAMAVAKCPACESVTLELSDKKEEMQALRQERKAKEKTDMEALKASDPIEFKKTMMAKKAEWESRKNTADKLKLTKEEYLAKEEALKASDPDMYQMQSDIKALVAQKRECEKECPVK